VELASNLVSYCEDKKVVPCCWSPKPTDKTNYIIQGSNS
jgi:hypothetical protein